MILIWLKFLHVIAVSVWAGGLLALPLLLAAQAGATANAVTRGHGAARHLYVGLISPAAVVAILTGGGLIAARGLHADWFAAKLTVVAVLAVIHVLAARQIVSTFGDDGPRPLLLRATSVVTAAAVLAILYIVLAKPGITFAFRCDGPGELRMLVLDQSASRASCVSTAMP